MAQQRGFIYPSLNVKTILSIKDSKFLQMSPVFKNGSPDELYNFYQHLQTMINEKGELPLGLKHHSAQVLTQKELKVRSSVCPEPISWLCLAKLGSSAPSTVLTRGPGARG